MGARSAAPTAIGLIGAAALVAGTGGTAAPVVAGLTASQLAIGASAASGLFAAWSAAKAAGENEKAAQKTAEARAADADRRAAEETNDLLAQARKDLASVQVAGSLMGASDASLARLASEVAGLSGTNRARIEINRLNERRGIASELDAAQAAASEQRTAAIGSAVGTAVGAGLQIQIDKDRRNQQADLNKRILEAVNG